MTPRERRFLLVGGVVGALVLAVRAGPAAAGWYHAYLERIDASEERLVRLRASVNSLDDLADSADQVRSGFVAIAPRILAGSSEAGALASLTGHLRAVADRSRARLDRTDRRPDSTLAGALHRVTVQATFESDTQGAAALLRSLDTSPVALSVSEVRIVATDPASPDAAPEVLRTEIVVSGWYLAEDQR